MSSAPLFCTLAETVIVWLGQASVGLVSTFEICKAGGTGASEGAGVGVTLEVGGEVGVGCGGAWFL